MTKKLAIDSDGEKLLLRLLNFNAWADARWEGSTAPDREALKTLPQGRWSAVEGAFVAPLTEPNVSHVMARWHPDELEITQAGRLLLDYHAQSIKLAEAHLADRLAFMRGEGAPNPAGYAYATPPYPHQVTAFASARTAEYFALFMEMGTGKTKVTIDVICDRVRKMLARHAAGESTQKIYWALVVAPKTVVHNWKLEFAKHSTIDVNLEFLRGSKLARAEAITRLIRDRCDEACPGCDKCGRSPLRVAITNYEGIEVIEEGLIPVPWDMMVCDESIWIKNPAAKRTKAACRIGQRAKARMILTGLPITRDVNDLYGQTDFLKPGLLGFDSYHAFAGHYGEKGYYGGHTKWRAERLPELQRLLARFSFIIRRAQCVDLPAKSYQVLDIEMADDQARAYDAMLNDFVCQLDGFESEKRAERALGFDLAQSVEELGDDKFAQASIVLTQMLRLAQITSGFVRKADGSVHRFSPNPKLEALAELLEELDPADKVIVWSRFVEDIESIHRRFPASSVQFYGALNDRQREYNIEKWKRDADCRLFIGQPQSGGFGINLTEAAHVVYFSNDFSLQNRAQSEDRCHRIGQTRGVLYSDLVVPKSIDEVVREKLRTKQNLADTLTDRAGLIALFRGQLEARHRKED